MPVTPVLLEGERMPMKRIPVGKEREKEYTLLVITAYQGSDNMVHLSIAIANAFGYCVGCERAGVRWR